MVSRTSQLSRLALVLSVVAFSRAISTATRHNVLLIVVDDLRPQTAAYGETYMHTPAMDKLAADGILFTRAYAQQSICSPTRNSFLSGRYPSKTKVWNFIDSFRDGGGENWTALPQFFRERGYFTTGAGKVYHPGHPLNEDQPKSWSEPWLGEFGSCNCGGHGFPPGGQASCEGLPQGVAECQEEKIVDAVFGRLEMAINGTLPMPFLIAAGLHKPHLPFYAPEQYFKLYPTPSQPIPREIPVGLPYQAYHSCLSNAHGNLNSNWGNFTDIPNNMSFEWPMTKSSAARLRRGYSASISYTDTNIGRILAAAEPLRDNLVVALIGDHGWSLGEGNEWCKMTNSENGVRIPLIIRPPKYAFAGAKVRQLAEAVDLYKTLADLTGIGAEHVESGVDGVSLAPVINDPSTDRVNPLRVAARSVFPRCYNETAFALYPSNLPKLDRTDCQDLPRELFDLMGYSIRTDEWRYTEYRKWDGNRLVARWDIAAHAIEMYSHRNEALQPGFSSELANVANVSANSATQKQLASLLREIFAPDATYTRH